MIIETILPSITSSKLFYISLESEDEYGFEGDGDPEIDYLAWGVVENHLCRLAKSFKAANPGRKTMVVIQGDGWCGPQMRQVLECINCEKFMPRLKQEAKLMLPR
jgi:hypothetical protein